MKRLPLLVVMLAIGIFCAVGAWTIGNWIEVPYEATSRVLVTAAHLDDISGYTRVYTDEENDYAVFVKDTYRAERLPTGTAVKYLNSGGTIMECSDTMFFVLPDDINAIVPGVSGSVVYYHSTPIGFISGWNGDGLVRCIFF